MIREAIGKVTKRVDLGEAETRKVFEEIMSGQASAEEIAGFLKALREKGETVEEITGAAKVMIEKSVRIDAGADLVDTCGTGGTGINTFNISTTAAFVAAGCGVKVAKHGNRSASSQCGSADVLESLGVKLDISPEMVRNSIIEIGIGFMYAPMFHSAMKYAAEPRKEIGGRTIFNILGPLSNPARASGQVVGVYDAKLTEILAQVLKNLGSKRALVVCGMDGLDEITITGKTKIAELKDGQIKTYYISPEEFGMKKGNIADIEGGSSKENARTTLSVLSGQPGPKRDVVLLNASAALVVASKAKDFKEGIKLAGLAIESGLALDKLKQLIELTNKK
ncbi:MAG: anthranilate phosphoribosyltransferase [Candidatus Omnitrophota bacterium]|nr:anthranilate phosphoribosyltransferase [Candidatus Omnitrophota bacterium]